MDDLEEIMATPAANRDRDIEGKKVIMDINP